MRPALVPGDVVIGWVRPLRSGAIVLAQHGAQQIIKRVERHENKKVFLVGDNRHESTDSRHYGNLNESAILGTIMIVLPRAVDPPKFVKPYAVWLGRLAALLFIGLVLAELFRIDTFLPLIDKILPGGSGWASAFAIALILSEIFAIPFALRMRLSPAAHYASGLLVALAPLWWVLIDIWAMGSTNSTGQLGEFVSVHATPVVLAVNVLWFAFCYTTLFLLGYNRLTFSGMLKK